MGEPVCCVSIDLDTVSCYESIHGLSPVIREEADPIYAVALPRMLALFAKRNIRATFFVVGRDVEHPEHAKQLRRAVEAGHELANHTYSHPYRLTRLPAAEIEAEIARADEVIGALLLEGQRVEGFRCPGYNCSPQVLVSLRKLGYIYDSSVFPCPPYLAARAAMIGLIALQGRESRSIPGPFSAWWAPAEPYLPGADPYRKARLGEHQVPLWELPMSLVPGIRLPYIGTSIMMYPKATLAPMSRLLAREYSLLNFEWHGIDMLDRDDPGLSSIASVQPDLKVNMVEKRARIDLCLDAIAQTHTFVPLREAVRQLDPHTRT